MGTELVAVKLEKPLHPDTAVSPRKFNWNIIIIIIIIIVIITMNAAINTVVVIRYIEPHRTHTEHKLYKARTAGLQPSCY